LPVHRHHHGKQATVYAFADEIDAWLQSRSAAVGADQLALSYAPEVSTQATPKTPQYDRSDRPKVIAVLPLRNLIRQQSA
jgi:hypothetical protein